MSKRCISNECLSTTGFSYTLSLINGKYKMTILYTLMEFSVVRFNEMKRYIGDISYKTPPDSAKGGVQSDGTGEILDSNLRRHVRVGGPEPIIE